MIETQDVGMVQRCGKFVRWEYFLFKNLVNILRLAPGGLNMICWPIECVGGQVTLKAQLLNVRCETKTLDNVSKKLV